MTGAVEFRALGPLEVRCGDSALPLGSRKQQVVLGLLAVNAGRTVSLDELVDEVWPDRPPASAVANVRGYAANLRRLLQSSIADGVDRLVRSGSGYLLRADPGELDLLAFSTQVSAGRRALDRGDVPAAAAAFAAGTARWRGAMLAGLPRGPLLLAQCAAIEEERLVVTEELAEAYLALGEPTRAATLLREHIRRNPLRERAYALLMRSLYHSGDAGAAVAVYGQARTTLVRELGIEPGRELQDLHRSILERDESLDRGEGISRATPQVVPAQLPAAVAGFVGREDSLEQLDHLLSRRIPSGTVVVCAISGTAGVGKTALALRWAHRIADQFPDGQLYVNLRGYDPSGSAMCPAEAIRGFLDAFEVPPQRLPASFEAQVGLYRSLLAGRRVLVVLDNARDAEQVRPLLPGSPGCLVVVTSRNQLGGLVAAEGAHPLALDPLSTDEAWDLLAARLGKDRVAAEPAAVDDIIAGCAGLPLVLAIAAARCAIRPGFPLAAVTDELRDARSALDMSADEDGVSDVRSVLSWSYGSLSDPAARLFRLLGLHCGPDIGLPAVASLAGTPVPEVEGSLTELVRANLVAEHVPGRFACHDLLRAYANEQVQAVDGEAERRAAIGRLLDYYLHTAHRAAMLLYPHRHPIRLTPPSLDVRPDKLADLDQARAWFSSQHRVLLAAVDLAAAAGFDTHVWQLAWTLTDFLDRQGHWPDWIATQQAAVAAAERLADPGVQAHAHRGLGRAYLRAGRADDAYAHLRQALGLFATLGERASQAHTHLSLVSLMNELGRDREALHHSQEALGLFRSLDRRGGQATALNNVAGCLIRLGDFQEAITHCHRALALQRELGDRYGEAETSDSLGDAYHHQGDHRRAAVHYRHALDICREVGDRYHEALVLVHLGDTLDAVADPGARPAWSQALEILEELGHPDADAVRGKLGG